VLAVKPHFTSRRRETLAIPASCELERSQFELPADFPTRWRSETWHERKAMPFSDNHMKFRIVRQLPVLFRRASASRDTVSSNPPCSASESGLQRFSIER
jgi:hypothetical protein